MEPAECAAEGRGIRIVPRPRPGQPAAAALTAWRPQASDRLYYMLQALQDAAELLASPEWAAAQREASTHLQVTRHAPVDHVGTWQAACTPTRRRRPTAGACSGPGRWAGSFSTLDDRARSTRTDAGLPVLCSLAPPGLQLLLSHKRVFSGQLACCPLVQGWPGPMLVPATLSRPRALLSSGTAPRCCHQGT